MRPTTNFRETPTATKVAVPRSLVDDYVDSYVRWREECHAVRHAYQLWELADLEDGAWAFALYDAALDYEEEAARELEGRIELIRLWCT
jgi:hypothetical protein